MFLLSDLRESLHSGDTAGTAGGSRRRSAGVWSGALLCSCSGLQSRVEVEGQRWSVGDEIETHSTSESSQLYQHIILGWILTIVCVVVYVSFLKAHLSQSKFFILFFLFYASILQIAYMPVLLVMKFNKGTIIGRVTLLTPLFH